MYNTIYIFLKFKEVLCKKRIFWISFVIEHLRWVAYQYFAKFTIKHLCESIL